MDELTYDLAPAKKTFSRVGFALCAIIVISTVLQVLFLTVPELIWGSDNWLSTSSWGMWITTFVPIYLVAIPVGILIMGKLPAQAPQVNRLEGKRFFVFLPICFCLMYGGNIIGTFLSLILSSGQAQNTVAEYAMDNNPLKVLVMVILAPLLEEYVCRKQIIDRTRQYGEKTAVFLSALCFGLLHQNLFQFFYAFALGLVFAYIYTRTGRLRYTVLLHSIVNFMGSVVAPWILSLLNTDAFNRLDPNATTDELLALYAKILPGLAVSMLYSTFLMGMSIAGLVLLIVRRKRAVWEEAENQLPKGSRFKTVYLNAGMLLYILLCLSSFVLALL